jgi:fimbrial isopeptide formation D2 family protein/uncharacterized repeat protein (TIGR01451 family)
VVLNQANLTFETQNGGSDTASGSVSVVVGQTAIVDVEPPGAILTDAGVDVWFAHEVSNLGNGTDQFDVSAVSTNGWATALFVDVDGDGIVSPADSALTGPLEIDSGDSAFMLVRVTVPGALPLGTTDQVTVGVDSRFDTAVRDEVINQISISDTNITEDFEKGVDRSQAAPGDLLTYAIRVRLDLATAGDSILLEDRIPAFATYEPGTIQFDGVPLTDADDGDGGSFDPATGVVRVVLSALPPGTDAVISLQARVDDSAPIGTQIANVARAIVYTPLGSLSEDSGAATTEVTAPSLQITKLVAGPDPATEGDSLVYTIEVMNPSTQLAATAVTVLDTLPDPLVLVRTDPIATITGPELRWAISRLEPGETRRFEIVAGVPELSGALTVVNRAHLVRDGASGEFAESPPVTLDPDAGGSGDPVVPTVEKSVDRSQAAPGDVLGYTIRVRHQDVGLQDSIVFADSIPEFATYEPGTLRLNGVSLTDAADGDGGFFDPATQTVRVELTGLPADTDAEIDFDVRIDGSAPIGTLVVNIARATIYSPTGQSEGESDPTLTSVDSPALEITKSVAGPNPATEGDSLVYTIEVTNPSSQLAATNATVVDTLPDPLMLLDVDPAATIDGRELRWSIARIEAGETVRFEIVTIVPEVTSLVEIANRAHLIRDGGTGEFAESERTTLEPPDLPGLDLGLEAEVLEIGIGESLPIVATVVNEGPISVTEVLLKLVLPDGTRFNQQETLSGSFTSDRPSPNFALVGGGAASGVPPALAVTPIQLDSFAVAGDTLRVWLPGELRPSESIGVRYSLTVLSARDGMVMNQATAEAQRGQFGSIAAAVISSNEATAAVALTRNRALETRTVIGKVFHDLNGNGLQDQLEPGIGGIDIITADGELITTDAFGKFSANNLRPGRHAFRIDPSSVPAELALRTRGIGQRMQVVEVTGWNTPRLSFALDGVEPAADPIEEWLLDAADDEVSPSGQIRVDALRTEEERDEDAASAFLEGPAIRITTPVDGFVAQTNRLYLRAEAEPMAPVALYRGEELIQEGTLLPDGSGDFNGLELEEGPQLFRVRTTNSWGAERWDSVSVHRSGRPVRLEPEDGHVLVIGDGRTPSVTRVRLFDAWDVPVTNEPYVTVRMDDGAFTGQDVDRSSVGHQLQADADGWVTIDLVGGRIPGETILSIESTETSVELPVRTVAPVRPLFVTGVGQLSLGAAGDDFAAITAQGRLTDETAVTLTFDSRRLDQGREVFGRNFDPLEEGQHPMLGDASVQRSLSPSRNRFFGRIDRGMDWVMVGDVQTSGFSDGMDLARYGRSVTGAAARVTTGNVIWNAFGASTTQALQQVQIRGSGTSGPFELGPGVLPGTEEVRLEIRALENPTRIVSERLLTRFAEYQIDYERGTLLLKQPVAAADPFGNPIFLTIRYEGESGGDRSEVWGVRASSEFRDLAGGVVDAMPVSMSFVNDAQPGNGFSLGAVQTSIVQNSGLQINAELALAEGVDSAGYATRVNLAAPLFSNRVMLGAEWSRISDEFSNPGNIGLQAGTEEVRANAGIDVGTGTVTAAVEHQDFGSRDLERSRATVGYEQEVLEDITVEARLAGDANASQGSERSSGAGEYKLTWAAMERLDVFAEGRNELWSSGDGLANRGAYYGAGASLRVAQGLAVEARHLRVTPAGDANPYSLTNIGLTSEVRAGTRAWGGYQIAGGIDGKRNAAIVGLNHRFALGPDWRFTTMLERRKGVGGASIGDPVLASPFEQPEEDYTAVAVGTEYIPETKPYRVSFRAENRDGTQSATRLATLAGDISFNASLGLLSRQDFVERDMAGSLTTLYTRERASLWGLAYRPTGRDDLNVLVKLAWKDAINPFGTGVLATDGEETRLIGSVEAIWAPRADTEFGARFATRSTRMSTSQTDSTTMSTNRNQTEFLGVRGRWYANDWAGVEVEARGLMSGLAPGAIWDLAPSVVAHPFEALEIELGYRFGELQDPDFAIRSGDGVFMTIGMRVTEDLLGSAADFWRSKMGGER